MTSLVDMTQSPGDAVFIDGKGVDGSEGTEAIRLRADGVFLLRGVPETDPEKIVAAFVHWSTRVLDAATPPSTTTAMPEEPIDPNVRPGNVAIRSSAGAAEIVFGGDGKVHIHGKDVGDVTLDQDIDRNDKLRVNMRRVLRRIQDQA
jgi:hypothetical protein